MSQAILTRRGGGKPDCILYTIPAGTTFQVSAYQGELTLDSKYSRYTKVLAPLPFTGMNDTPIRIRISGGKLIFEFSGFISGTAKFSETVYLALY